MLLSVGLVTIIGVTLLERHTQLAELAAAERDAASGRGSLVLVTGEAGIGKTELVRQFAEGSQAQVWWGMCDELLTPRPLGPFRDMFGGAEHAAQGEFLDAILSELDGAPQPAVVVVEDAHWADRATLDAIRFLGRRIGRRRALLIATYRDDEVPADHALRLAVGAVPAGDVRRVRLGPLSRDAVVSLAGGAGVDPAALYELTGGNPFYVTETLAHPGITVPPSVQDAVMARVARLGAHGRASAEVASAVPGATELTLIDDCGVSAGLDEACQRGVLRIEGDVVRFSHEIARRAVEELLPDSRRLEVNGRILDALSRVEADPARLTHHAVRAGRADAVARYAPLAAQRAAAVGAQHEAFDHYERALEHADRFTTDELIGILEAAARSARAATKFKPARHLAEWAVRLCRGQPDRSRLSPLLRLLADVEWHTGHGERAQHAADEAVAVLEADTCDVPAELADAYALQARLAMLDHRPDEAIAWGEKAAQLFERAGIDEPVDLLVTIGTAALQRDPNDQRLATALRAAIDTGHRYAASRAYCNLADELTLHMRYEQARPHLEGGLAYLDSHDDLAGYGHLLAVRSQWHLDQGRWAEAEHDARRVLEDHHGPSAVMAQLTVALVQARRGDPTAAASVQEADARAVEAAEAQHLVPAALARAELAWLTGADESVTEAIEQVLPEIQHSVMRRWVGEATLWLHRFGVPRAATGPMPEPYVLHLAGRCREAAVAWMTLGRPYEAADALADSAEPELLLEALATLDRLGAKPRAAMTRQRLADLGVHAVPRGPRPKTQANPAGLTGRQTEVLGLLAEGLTYRAIADRLHLSVKTVDHHATAIRAKLVVASRSEAVAVGRRLGILS
jgi:DNA-binding CsgD family transcriptional regulator